MLHSCVFSLCRKRKMIIENLIVLSVTTSYFTVLTNNNQVHIVVACVNARQVLDPIAITLVTKMEYPSSGSNLYWDNIGIKIECFAKHVVSALLLWMPRVNAQQNKQAYPQHSNTRDNNPLQFVPALPLWLSKVL